MFSIAPSAYKQIYTIGCGISSLDETLSVVIIDHIEGVWRALDLLPGANEWDVADDRITIGGTPYTWDGSALVRMG